VQSWRVNEGDPHTLVDNPREQRIQFNWILRELFHDSCDRRFGASCLMTGDRGDALRELYDRGFRGKVWSVLAHSTNVL
jgi:hypothetical protein